VPGPALSFPAGLHVLALTAWKEFSGGARSEHIRQHGILGREKKIGGRHFRSGISFNICI